MLAKVPIKCPDCDRICEGQFDTVDHSLTSTCPHCGKRVIWIVGLKFHIGHALISYSSNVLSGGDTNFSILLCGMAIDCYLSRLYFKWRNIEELLSSSPYDPNIVRDKIQDELTHSGDFLAKIRKVEALLHPQGTADFIKAHSELENEIQSNFPEIQIDRFGESVRNEVMWKRNNIVHSDQVKYNQPLALKGLKYSKLFITVFQKMDEVKSATVS